MKKREICQVKKRLRELEEKLRRGELVPVKSCDICQRGYTYCAPFDRWIPGECTRRPEAIWKE